MYEFSLGCSWIDMAPSYPVTLETTRIWQLSQVIQRGVIAQAANPYLWPRDNLVSECGWVVIQYVRQHSLGQCRA